MNKICLALGVAVSLTACGQADKENAAKLQQEVNKLQGEVTALRTELEAERNGPDRLLAKAKNEISQANLALAKQTLIELIARYPETQQAQGAKSVLSDLNANIEAIEKAKQLEAAKAAEQQRQTLARLDANLRKNTDEIKGVTWISHKSEPVLDNYMSLYFGTKNGSASAYPLRMKFNYFADSWLFVQSVTIKADDRVFNLDKMDFERDNGSGSIWEWSDSKVEDMAMLNKIIAAKKVVIRYDGRQYYHDFVLPEAQKNAMKEILLAWNRYGGKE
ncbi:hypothetical protein [Pseudomonas laurylsulfatiphila]